MVNNNLNVSPSAPSERASKNGSSSRSRDQARWQGRSVKHQRGGSYGVAKAGISKGGKNRRGQSQEVYEKRKEIREKLSTITSSLELLMYCKGHLNDMGLACCVDVFKKMGNFGLEEGESVHAHFRNSRVFSQLVNKTTSFQKHYDMADIAEMLYCLGDLRFQKGDPEIEPFFKLLLDKYLEKRGDRSLRRDPRILWVVATLGYNKNDKLTQPFLSQFLKTEGANLHCKDARTIFKSLADMGYKKEDFSTGWFLRILLQKVCNELEDTTAIAVILRALADFGYSVESGEIAFLIQKLGNRISDLDHKGISALLTAFVGFGYGSNKNLPEPFSSNISLLVNKVIENGSAKNVFHTFAALKHFEQFKFEESVWEKGYSIIESDAKSQEYLHELDEA